MLSKKNIEKVLDSLEIAYPEADCALKNKNVYELLVAVALSAQTTDVSVNKISGELFSRYPNSFALAQASLEDVESVIKFIGMYKNKSKNIVAMAKMLVEKYNGVVPEDYEKLIELPGVGRKTANVVLSVGFGHPRIAVDTHVFRVSNRIGIVREDNVLKTEEALMKKIPKSRWSRSHHSLIFHGRNCCNARKPKCEECPIEDICEKFNI